MLIYVVQWFSPLHCQVNYTTRHRLRY